MIHALLLRECTRPLHLYNYLFVSFHSMYDMIFNMQGSCIGSLEKYGVGSCGPRGFYGTIGKPAFFHPLFMALC